ncbi:MAG: recombinase family protein, partial [Chloroflexota bacterium]
AAQEEYERRREAGGALVDEQQRTQIVALATDFPRLWRDPRTPDRERKRMVRLLLIDVTVLKQNELVAHVRFRGGVDRTLRLPLPLNAWQLRQTDPLVLAEIDRLLDHHTDREVVAILNERGVHPGQAARFNRLLPFKLRTTHGLADRFTRLRRRGLLTQEEMAEVLHVRVKTVQVWHHAGLLVSHRYNDKGGYLYEPPGDNTPRNSQGKPLRLRQPPLLAERSNEVQCGA